MKDSNHNREKIEEKYKNLSFELEALIDIIPGMVFCKDKNNVITRVNQHFADFLKLNKEDIVGKTSFDFFPPDQAEKFQKDDLDVLRSGKPKLNIEESVDSHEGIRFAIINKVPHFNEKGEIIGIIGLLIDITERKVTEHKLKESEQKYRDLFDKAPNAYVSFDLNYTILSWNKAAEKIYGWNVNEVISKNINEIIPVEFPYDNPEDVLREFSEKGHWNGEGIQHHKNGTPINVLSSSTFIEDTDGNRIGILTINRDITNRKKAEQKLRDSEKRFKYLIASNPAIIYTSEVSADYGASFISDNVEEKWGYKTEDFVKNSEFWLNHVHPDDKKYVIEVLSDLYEKEHAIFDYRFKLKDGTYHWIRDEAKLLKDNKGNPVEIIGSVIDISERKKAEQKLKESEEKYRNLFERSPNAIVLLDFTGKIIECNSATETIFGYSKDDLIGQNYLQLPFYSKSMINVLKERLQTITKGVELKPQELEIKKKNGEIALVKTKISCLKIGEKNLFQAIIQDITEQKNAEQKLKESEENYREAYERAEFYKDLFAHDISNILQNIQSSLDLLLKWRNQPEKIEKTIEVMNIVNDQIVRGSKLVSNIRKLSQISKTKVSLISVEICQILKDAIEFIRKSYHEKDLNIEIDSRTEEIFVQANELLLDAFENILINAIKYNINPKIEISTKLSKEIKNGTKFIKIEFIDNGVGVPDVMKERILGGIALRKDKVHGMGLGLLFVKSIVTNFNGQIWIEDKINGDPSQGSNFVILIPELV